MPLLDIYQIGPFLGENNRLERHALMVVDSGHYLAEATNVDIDATGRIGSGGGSTLFQPVTSGRSIFSGGGHMLYAAGNDLRRVLSLAPFSSANIASIGAGRVSYSEINGEVFFSDGATLGCVEANGTAREVGIPVPAAPILNTAAGGLPPGRYFVALTYFRGQEEGGASIPGYADLATTSGIEVAMPAAPSGVTGIGVYLTAANGEMPMLHSVVTPGPASISLSTLAGGRACLTQFMGPMPPGGLLASIPGYLLSASGNIVYFSAPYNFGLTDPAKNYIAFPQTVSMMADCGSGVYVASDKTYWLTGIGTEQMAMAEVLPYGAVAGSSSRNTSSGAVFWLSERGICTGDGTGQVANLQEKNMALSLTGSGASVFIEEARRVVATNG